MLKRLISLFIFVTAYINCAAFAQVGLFIRPNSSSLSSPVQGQTWLFNSTNNTMSVYNGSIFQTASQAQGNFAASTNPTATNDNTEGYTVNSVWYNTSNSNLYICVSAATTAAIWVQTNNLGGLSIPLTQLEQGGAAGGQSLIYNTGTGHWAPGSVLVALSQLTQSAAGVGQVPQWNGTAWVPVNVSATGLPGGGAGNQILNYGSGTPGWIWGLVGVDTTARSGNITLTGAENSYIVFDPDGVDSSIYLPPAASFPNKIYYFHDVGNGSADGIVVPDGSDTIEGSDSGVAVEGTVRVIGLASRGSSNDWRYILPPTFTIPGPVAGFCLLYQNSGNSTWSTASPGAFSIPYETPSSSVIGWQNGWIGAIASNSPVTGSTATINNTYPSIINVNPDGSSGTALTFGTEALPGIARAIVNVGSTYNVTITNTIDGNSSITIPPTSSMLFGQQVSSGGSVTWHIIAQYPASGAGTVTSVATGTGLTGGTITSTGTISVASGSNNTLAGYNGSGVFSGVTVGSGLSLSGGTLTASGGGSGTVSSGTAGQLGYYSSNGTTIAPLNVGSNLSITSGTLNASGSGGGTIPGFGDTSNYNPLPTSGSIPGGVYRTSANWTQTGAITFAASAYCYFGGTATFNNTVTVTAGQDANSGGVAATAEASINGLGQGEGFGQVADDCGGAGGGHGGGGGQGEYSTSIPGGIGGLPYATLLCPLIGSGGAGGAYQSSTPGAGGGGGGALYIEATGNVLFTSSMTASCNGVNGSSATLNAGGGGSGGGIDVRSLGTIIVNSGSTLTANGGNGGVSGSDGYGGGGGGGVINLMALGGVTQSGTLSVTGGVGTTSGSIMTQTAGATGVTYTNLNFYGPRQNF
jgi:hypothetical protein